MEQNNEILEDQIRQIFAGVVWTQKLQEKQADMYRNRYNILETVKIVISPITSAGIISIIFMDDFYLKLITAVISMISIGITTYFKTFDLPGLMNQHKSSSLQLLHIREQLISLLSDIKIQRLKTEDIIKKRDEILSSLQAVYDGSIDPSAAAVGLAEKALKQDKGFTYTDQEIDSYLPVHLRKSNIA